MSSHLRIKSLLSTLNKKRREKDFRVLYKENANKFMYLIYRYVGNKSDAEDLLQEGFLRIIDKLPQYNGSGSFEGWARRIMINLALEHLRKNKKIRVNNMQFTETSINAGNEDNLAFCNEFDFESLPEKSVNMEVIYAADFTDEDLEEAIHLLPEHYKVVFNLFSIDGFKHKEISEMLGINEKTSKSRLSKARKITQTYLYNMAIKKVRREQYETK